MEYLFITTNSQPLTADNPETFIELMSQSGYAQNGVHNSPSTRIELQGQPKFLGVCGPMYNGSQGIRYETIRAYRFYSAGD
jgi:hypothetical protein